MIQEVFFQILIKVLNPLIDNLSTDLSDNFNELLELRVLFDEIHSLGFLSKDQIGQ